MRAFFHRLKSLCTASFPFVMFCLVVSNFCLSCSAFRSARPQYRYTHVTVTNETVQVVSNVSSIVSSVDSPVRENRQAARIPEFHKKYKFFVLDSTPMAFMDGFYYQAGDTLSQGRIVRIFPDCIFLHDGGKIVNTETRFDPKPKVEVNNND